MTIINKNCNNKRIIIYLNIGFIQSLSELEKK